MKVLVTSAWPYAYGVPHLGNLIGSLLSGDVFARYYRLRGHDTLYVSGSDMHGTRAEFEARKKGITPDELTKKNHKAIKKAIEDFEIKFDNYTTTESPIHKEFAQDLYRKAEKNGYISTATEKRAFCTNDELFLADAFIEGECPHCKEKGAKGNQCDSCGKLLEAEELINPICRVCNKEDIEFRSTKHWYLNLDKLEPKLKRYVESHPEWKGNVKNFTLNLIKDGLKPRAITRDLKWGIKPPFEGADNKVLYVWAEAALGYVTAAKEHTDRWTDFWFNKDAKHIYAIGKDNIPFHTIVFPGQLLATEEGYHLPDQLVATEYLNWIGGKKFSKTTNTGIYMDDAIKLMPVTAWRFYLLYDRPETKDTNFSWGEVDKTVNQVLIGSIGNLVNRTLTLLQKNFKGKVPEVELRPEDQEVIELIHETEDLVSSTIEDIGSLRIALEEISRLSNLTNTYLQQQEPWNNKDNMPNSVYTCTQVVKALSIMLSPFIPSFSEDIWNMLNIEEKMTWKELENKLEPGHMINPPNILIQKVDIEELKKKYEGLKNGDV